ncbi:hypothetical protein Tsubulata_028197 [Turnera subulata]|uniref:Uncharacterized protein n=1 Tax=Turnera subulata TaxID=218843 RepID=A0A9Q0FME0_9ROSI|nr:hypothetical protein Tsubulata_028197 [Turnera subulata]
MAFIKPIFYCLVITTLLLLVVLEASSGCHRGEKCFYAQANVPMEKKSRKMLAVLKSGLGGPVVSNNGQKLVYSELRNVPSGPDPLHHNGGSPKKPRTP